MFKAFIVEDELPAMQRVKKLLSDYSTDLNIVGEADCGKNAIEQIETKRPDVLFLDIQLPDMTGFEVLSALTYQPLVIFTTAYENYAIKAFESYSIDYLVKPFDVDRFKKAIEKLKKLGHQEAAVDYQELEKLLLLHRTQPVSVSLAVKKADKIILLNHEDMTYFKAEDKYVRIFTKNGKDHLCEKSLAKLEQVLPDNFIRVHRSFIVNRNHISEVRKYFKGKLILQLRDKEQTTITTGEKYSSIVKSILGI